MKRFSDEEKSVMEVVPDAWKKVLRRGRDLEAFGGSRLDLL